MPHYRNPEHSKSLYLTCEPSVFDVHIDSFQIERLDDATFVDLPLPTLRESSNDCFDLVVEPGDGPVWLEVTGPEGTEDFLSTLLDNTFDTTPGTLPGR